MTTTHKKTGRKEVKATMRVKAWGILDEYDNIIAIEFGKSKPTRYNVGTWVFFTSDIDGDRIVHLTLTYNLPTPTKRKKIKIKIK